MQAGEFAMDTISNLTHSRKRNASLEKAIAAWVDETQPAEALQQAVDEASELNIGLCSSIVLAPPLRVAAESLRQGSDNCGAACVSLSCQDPDQLPLSRPNIVSRDDQQGEDLHGAKRVHPEGDFGIAEAQARRSELRGMGEVG